MRRRRDRFDVSKVEKPGIAALTGDAAQPSTFHGSGVRYASRLRQGILRLGIDTKGQRVHPPLGRSFNTPGKQQRHTGPAGAASGAMPIAPTREAPPGRRKASCMARPNARAGTRGQTKVGVGAGEVVDYFHSF